MLAQKLKSYDYYDPTGQLLGQTEGTKPCETLYMRAHYVVEDQRNMLKNLDPQPVLKKFIPQYRAELVKTPLNDLPNILELVQLIQNLEKFVKPAQ